jgi:zinc protease
MRNQNYLTQRRKAAKLLSKKLNKIFAPSHLCAFALILFVLNLTSFAQTETPPKPGAPRVAKIPAVVEKKLPNGLTVATVERKNVPLVTIEILVKSGARAEAMDKAGLANMTASMLTKGTKTKTASQIAEQIEFLGGSISAAAGWNNSVVQINVMSDKLDAAMAILSDVVLNPTFKQDELDLLKSQSLDGLTYSLKQPGFLANYVASKYSFGEHPAGGTPDSLNKITAADIVNFKNENYTPYNSVLIFTGDINAARANALAQKFFAKWKEPVSKPLLTAVPMKMASETKAKTNPESQLVKRFLVVDLPNSGQASVNYSRNIDNGRVGKCLEAQKCDTNDIYFPANALNSVLGGGYSSRLNQEIRIKRGLSYGAGSNFGWRWEKANFSTSTQTKNESAAEVAELVLAEIERLTTDSVSEAELNPRKLVLTGDFGRDLETTGGLADKVGELYGFYLSPQELNSFISNVQSTSSTQIKAFAQNYLKGGNIIIVGDYSVFKADLAKRFPNMKIEVIKADSLDLSKDNLQK